MPDVKKSTPLAAALALGVAIGAGGHSAVTKPAHAVEAKATVLRLLGDGQMAAAFQVKVGAAQAPREIVWAKDGSNPRLNGVPTKEQAALDLGKAAVNFAESAGKTAEALAERMSQP